MKNKSVFCSEGSECVLFMGMLKKATEEVGHAFQVVSSKTWLATTPTDLLQNENLYQRKIQFYRLLIYGWLHVTVELGMDEQKN